MNNELVFKEIMEKIDKLEKTIKPGFPNWMSVKQLCEYIGLSQVRFAKWYVPGKSLTKDFHLLNQARSGSIASKLIYGFYPAN